jgi:hypothetical protein
VRYRIVRHGVGLDSVSVKCFIALMVAAMCGHYDTVRTLFFLARARLRRQYTAAVIGVQWSSRRSCAAAVDARGTKHWLLVPHPQRRDGAVHRGGAGPHPHRARGGGGDADGLVAEPQRRAAMRTHDGEATALDASADPAWYL